MWCLFFVGLIFVVIRNHDNFYVYGISPLRFRTGWATSHLIWLRLIVTFNYPHSSFNYVVKFVYDNTMLVLLLPVLFIVIFIKKIAQVETSGSYGTTTYHAPPLLPRMLHSTLKASEKLKSASYNRVLTPLSQVHVCKPTNLRLFYTQNDHYITNNVSFGQVEMNYDF